MSDNNQHIPSLYGFPGRAFTPDELTQLRDMILRHMNTIEEMVAFRLELDTPEALDEAAQLTGNLDLLRTALATCEDMRPAVLALQRSLIRTNERTWRQNIGQYPPRCGRWRRRQGALP